MPKKATTIQFSQQSRASWAVYNYTRGSHIKIRTHIICVLLKFASFVLVFRLLSMCSEKPRYTLQTSTSPIASTDGRWSTIYIWLMYVMSLYIYVVLFCFGNACVNMRLKILYIESPSCIMHIYECITFLCVWRICCYIVEYLSNSGWAHIEYEFACMLSVILHTTYLNIRFPMCETLRRHYLLTTHHDQTMYAYRRRAGNWVICDCASYVICCLSILCSSGC